MEHRNSTEEKHRYNEPNVNKSIYNTTEDGTAHGGKKKVTSDDKRFRSDRDTSNGSSTNAQEEGASVWGSKRKADACGECLKKRLRVDSDLYSSSSCSVVAEGASVQGRSQRADGTEGSPRTDVSDSKDTSSSEGGTNSDETPKTSESPRHSSDEEVQYDFPFLIKTGRDEFEEMYQEVCQIGEGAYGSVYSGYRRTDNVPVAMKHIQAENVFYIKMVQNGTQYLIPEEVALMEKATGGAKTCGISAAIALLDCFDLEEELILVMERPVPCMDLEDYRIEKGGHLTEDNAKVILRQMVEAVIEIHSNGVFHRDIKMENVLVEVGPDGPRARLIDFGCSCLVKNGSYNSFSGTPLLAPPEWFLQKNYNAAPTTVWQLGVLLYDLLHQKTSFDTMKYLWGRAQLDTSLSTNCRNFFELCLATQPEKRGTFEDLWLHPWLK